MALKIIPGRRPTPFPPAHLSYPQLASLPTAGGTAYNALFLGPLPLSPSMSILTQGTGGVSVFAIQLASALGLTDISTFSSPKQLELAKQLGAKYLIKYTETPDWASKVLELTGGNGVDHVIDVGGSGTIFQSLKAVR
jgi:NADPH:quinone reductase-like Zn-dependent oxidoreductase